MRSKYIVQMFFGAIGLAARFSHEPGLEVQYCNLWFNDCTQGKNAAGFSSGRGSMSDRNRVPTRSARVPDDRTARIEMPAVLFDLDGTLIDSNYQHVSAWSEAISSAGIVIPIWKVHRRIGMSGKSFLRELLREKPYKQGRVDLERLERKHDLLFQRTISRLAPLPGANQLLKHLSRHRIRIAIATTGSRKQTTRLLRRLEIPVGTAVVTGDDAEHAKPSPDIFMQAALRLGVRIDNCIVVGDSAWDLLAAGRKSALGVGLLSGGYGEEELERAGAFRVYSDTADMLMHLEQLGLPGQ